MEGRDGHVAANTARAVEEIATTAGETVQPVQDTARQIPNAAPKTFKSAISLFVIVLCIVEFL
jgi:hypothetical protein